MITTLTPSLRYIGADDPTLDLFESQYRLPAGMCYNSYLLTDSKVAILDTCDRRCADLWRQNLREALEGRQPDYLVCHHMEPDHAALIAETLAAYPTLTLVASQRALQMLPQFFEGIDLAGRTLAVGDGDTLTLGEHTLRFLTATMVHWPEVIVSFDEAEGTLFSADAFGKFGTRLSDADDWACEARRYYFNICGKYGPQVMRLLDKAAQLPIQRICPLHGPWLTDDLPYYIGLYRTWGSYEPETDGVLVAYASIHGATRQCALRLADILREKGAAHVAVADLTRCDQAEALEDAFRYPRMALAAASYDASVFPPMYDFLHHLQLKAYQRRRVALIENGSWAPTAAKVMRQMLAEMKAVDIVEPVVTIRSAMHEADVPKLEALADALLA